VTHGAISPEHLMITFEGVVKCKDFGIFRLYPADQRDSLGGPNPVYMSVEQEQGLQPNMRSDLYSLGRVFQKLLSLSTEGSKKQLPHEILQVLSGLLKADPAQRPKSAAAVEPTLVELVRSHGSGEETDRPQLGAYIREMFTTEAAKVQAKSEVVAEKEDASAKDVSLLDPAIFWGGTDQPIEDSVDDATPTLEDEALKKEASGEAVVVSSPVGQPKELFLPESERIVVTPSPEPDVASAPAPAVPQKDFIQVGMSRKGPLPVVGIAVGACLLLAIAVWSLGGDGESVVNHDAAVVGPVKLGAEKATPPVSEEAAVVSPDPEPPKPVNAKTGIIKLDSNPPGALVYVNDEKIGVTPLTLRDITIGSEASIRVELEDHRPWTQTVVLEKESSYREITAGLLKEEKCELGVGWVYVTTEPEGGSVELDGKRLPGKTPMLIDNVCAGVEHKIRVQASGYRAWSREVKVSSQKVLNLNIELER
jgi:hypothetical protein